MNTELRIARVDGSQVRTVLALPAAGIIHHVRWSPDGRRLAFVLLTHNPASLATWGAVGNRWDTYVINVDGSGLRPVAPLHPVMANWIEWSPDGTQLAFVSDASGVPGVHTVAVDGLPVPSRVSPLGIASRYPRWSPDGESIAFIGTATLPALDLFSAPHLWITAADGSAARQLPVNAWDAPAWSPDGSQLAYSCIEEGCGVGVIGADGTGGRILTGVPRTTDHSRAWSRGGQIAFVRSDNTRCCPRTLWVMTDDGSGQRQLTDASEVVFGISWSK